ncbi:hypothetical protein LSAT2_000360, partial [Lamellibrachia satsuma]
MALMSRDNHVLRNVFCLHDWPVQLLADNMEKAVMCFRRWAEIWDTGLVRRHGSCTVLKKLRKVKPARARKRRKLPPLVNQESHCASLERLLREEDSKKERCDQARTQHDLKDIGLALSPHNKLLSESESETDHVFVAIQTLSKGDVFGLADLLYEQQPNFSLVSNGAECIMIDKRFYVDNAPQALMRRLRAEVSPYPSDGEMQAGLESHVNWERNKADVWRQAVSNATARKRADRERQQRSMILALLR